MKLFNSFHFLFVGVFLWHQSLYRLKCDQTLFPLISLCLSIRFHCPARLRAVSQPGLGGWFVRSFVKISSVKRPPCRCAVPCVRVYRRRSGEECRQRRAGWRRTWTSNNSAAALTMMMMTTILRVLSELDLSQHDQQPQLYLHTSQLPAQRHGDWANAREMSVTFNQ